MLETSYTYNNGFVNSNLPSFFYWRFVLFHTIFLSLLYNVKMRNRERLGYPSNKTVIKADVAEILRLRLSLLLPA